MNTFEYEADHVEVGENGIRVDNVGFKGFQLNPPDGYELVAIEDLPAGGSNRLWAEWLRSSYQNSEGIGYHFHRDFVFQKGLQVIYFVPFQNKAIRQFMHTPDDLKERYLIDWVRHAEFSKIIKYDLSWRAESDSRGHSTAVLQSKQPTNGLVYEERVMTGDLNEMFIFAGFANEKNRESMSRDLQLFAQSLQVLR